MNVNGKIQNSQRQNNSTRNEFEIAKYSSVPIFVQNLESNGTFYLNNNIELMISFNEIRETCK